MAKSYSRASSDVERTIERMREQFHPQLRNPEQNLNVTVGALFVFDLESTEPVLKHQGYAAAAVVKITPLKDRVLGIPDATIVVDRSTWMTMTPRQRDALIDHELYHLDLVLDAETGGPTFDAHGRPRMEMRLHDRQFGWFDAIARRHGEHSTEIRQAKYLLAETQQLYFDFAPGQPAESAGSDGDELVERAVEYVRQFSQVSTLQLQERFEVGHTTATSVMTVLQERGVIGHVRPNGKHDVQPFTGIKVDAKGNVSGGYTTRDGTKVEISGRLPVPETAEAGAAA